MSVDGVCAGCGVVGWELLSGVSDCCLDCDPASYRDDDECEFADWRDGAPRAEDREAMTHHKETRS